MHLYNLGLSTNYTVRSDAKEDSEDGHWADKPPEQQLCSSASQALALENQWPAHREHGMQLHSLAEPEDITLNKDTTDRGFSHMFESSTCRSEACSIAVGKLIPAFDAVSAAYPPYRPDERVLFIKKVPVSKDVFFILLFSLLARQMTL